jgi:hypothetical protein
MEKFIKTGLISMLYKSAQKEFPVPVWEKSRHTFVSKVLTAADKLSLPAYCNALCCAKIELQELQSHSGVKEMMVRSFSRKAKGHIDIRIEFAERQMPACTPPSEQLQWQGSMMEFVELVYALHEAGSFGTVSLTKLFDVTGKAFGIEISNYYRLFWDIQNRKSQDGERTFFLNKLRKALSAKLTRKDKGERK